MVSFNFWSFLIYGIPWPVQVAIIAVLIAALFLLAVRLFGWQRVRPWVLPALALLGAIGLAQRNRQAGYGDRIKEEEKAVEKLTDDFEAIQRHNEGLTEDELDKKNDRWLDRTGRS